MGRFAKRVVLAFDADGAGQAAAERVYAWEEEFGLRFAVAALPDGADPGDLAGSDPDGLRLAIEEARPFLEFRVDRVLARSDLDSAEGRAATATEAMALVSEHPDAMVRDQYAMRIADRCLVGVDEVRRRGVAGRAGRPSGIAIPRPAGGSETAGPGHVTPEDQALRLLVHRPDEVRELFVPVLFADPVRREAFDLLAGADDLHAARAVAEGAVADLLGRVAVADATDDDPLGVLTRLAYLAAERTVVSLEAEARRSGDLAAYQPAISYLRTEVMRLREVVADDASLETLLRWLADYSGGRVDV